MLDQIGLDLQEAVQELRNLAHGIYPPLLMDRGLAEALRARRGPRRARRPTVEAEDVGRYPQQVEAAVYFCCLEALQNAGKHAGEGATRSRDGARGRGRVAVRGRRRRRRLRHDERRAARPRLREHEPTASARSAARVGVESAPGKGTTISGRDPARRRLDR